jgi:hypothetical protein
VDQYLSRIPDKRDKGKRGKGSGREKKLKGSKPEKEIYEAQRLTNSDRIGKKLGTFTFSFLKYFFARAPS